VERGQPAGSVHHNNTNNLDTVIALGYDGIVFDIEQSTEIIGIPEWNSAFEAVRAAGLIVMVTISHFSS